MKRIIFLMFAAFAALCVCSCTKQDAETQAIEQGKTIVYASFADFGTKTTLVNGKVPTWQIGDEIWLSDGAVTDCGEVIGVEDNVAKIAVSKQFSGDNVYAVYPYRENVYSVADDQLVIDIPAVQTGAFEDANIMVAMNKSSKLQHLNFKNAVCILQVKWSDGVPVDHITFNKTGIAGKFSVDLSDYDNPVVAAVEGQTANSITSEVSKPECGAFYYAAAPGLKYVGKNNAGAGAEAVADYAQGSLSGQKKFKNDLTLGRKQLVNLGIPVIDLPGILTGEFTVAVDGSGNPTKKVHFSQGNLYIDANSDGALLNGDKSYHLEAEQYYFRNYNGARDDAAFLGTMATTPANTVGTFYYSASVQAACAMRYNDNKAAIDTKLFTNTKEDKSNLSIDGVAWRALKQDEYNTVLFVRKTDTGHRFFKGAVKVNGTRVNGLFLIPDICTWPESVDEPVSAYDKKEVIYENAPEFSTNEFKLLEAAGIVFFPGAGNRDDSYYYRSETDLNAPEGALKYNNDGGVYWSTTLQDEFGNSIVKAWKPMEIGGQIYNMPQTYGMLGEKVYFANGMGFTDHVAITGEPTVEAALKNQHEYWYKYSCPIRLVVDIEF